MRLEFRAVVRNNPIDHRPHSWVPVNKPLGPILDPQRKFGDLDIVGFSNSRVSINHPTIDIDTSTIRVKLFDLKAVLSVYRDNRQEGGNCGKGEKLPGS